MLYQNNQFLCGDYVRLSREDGDKLESNSIHNQKELISDYHKSHPELTFVKEYVDDGYTGTNFERPGFQEMMQDAQDGVINCIIVKDLSRLGRDYIEMGRYTERIFPVMGIRFIAINDNYDSAANTNDSDSIIIPFKNLINDSYSRDMSTKIRSHLDVKRKNGEFIGSFASYGYMKDPQDKNHLVVDEYAAGVVRMIYQWKLSGMSSLRISHHLDDMGILTPMEYKHSCSLNYNGGFRAKQDAKWSVNSVNRILRNEMYTGTMVQGKRKKISYKLKKQLDVDEKDWIKVENTHEAIIPKNTFGRVQDMLALDTRTGPRQKAVYPFAGILRCGDCGQSMIRRCSYGKGKVYHYYHCSTYINRKGCTSHIIKEEKLTEAVISSIQKQVELLMDAQDIVSAAAKGTACDRDIKTLENQISQLEKEVERDQGLKDHLYEDLHNDVIDAEEYKRLVSRFTGQLRRDQDKIAQLEEKKKSLLINNDKDQSWLDELCSYGNITHLDRKTLTAIVDYIMVYSGDRIEIRFRYQDEMNKLLERAENCKDSLPANGEVGI